MVFVRTVKTSSGATAVQIVWSWRKGSRSIEHLGSARDDVELAALKAAAAERLAGGQTELFLGISGSLEPGTLPILSSQMSHLWDALCAAYRILGFESATKGDNVFRDLVLARIIEPTSKVDAERVLSEVGAASASYATVKRRLRSYAQPGWRRALAAASATHAGLGPASLVLFEVSTLLPEVAAAADCLRASRAAAALGCPPARIALRRQPVRCARNRRPPTGSVGRRLHHHPAPRRRRGRFSRGQHRRGVSSGSQGGGHASRHARIAKGHSPAAARNHRIRVRG